MKVYFCNSFLESCYYARCLIPMREGGWDGDRTSLRVQRKPPEIQAQAVTEADIVVFHRPNDERSLEIAQKLRQSGKKIVFENDDTYKQLNDEQINQLGLAKVDKATDEFIKKADLVTCTTEFLAEEYRKSNSNVVVLPNCVDPEDWPEEDEILRNDGPKVRIGMVGSVAIANDFANFKHVIENLVHRDDVQLVLFGLPSKTQHDVKTQSYYHNEYEYWESLPNIEWQPFVSIADYAETLNNLKLDIMVIPRRDEYFNRCKSNIKFLEASMLEIPVIAQGFNDNKSPYQVDSEDSAYMKIIVDNNNWMPVLDEMIKSKEERRAIGKSARKYVLNKYSIANNIDKWIKAYQDLLS